MGWPKGKPRKTPVSTKSPEVEVREEGKYAGMKSLKISVKHQREGFITIPIEEVELLDSDSVVEMVFDNLMQYVHDFIPLMNEVNRVLEVNGTVTIVVPVYPHKFAFQDPMTVRQFTDTTFLYFWNQAPFWEMTEKEYGILPFKALSQSANGPYMTSVLRK